jgi:replicative DNA helicase
MTNWELKLIAKILDTGDLKTPIKERIIADVFHHPDARAVFDYVHAEYKDKGAVPTLEMVEHTFPRVRIPAEVREELVSLCDHVRKMHLATEIKQASLEASELAESDPDAALASFTSKGTRLAGMARGGEEVSITEGGEEMKRKYDLMKKLRRTGQTLGIEYPWEILNQESMGMLPGEFILFYGRPKSLKTFVTCHIAAHAYFKSHRRVLFFTTEMRPEQIQARVLCSIAKEDYGFYRRGEMDIQREEEFFTIAEGLRTHGQTSVKDHGRSKAADFIIAADTRAEGASLPFLQSLAEQYSPDIIFIDGIYHMRDDQSGQRRDWKSVAGITTGLKMMAQRLGIPIVANTQANRSGEDQRNKGKNLSDVAFSDASGQDADLIIKIIKEYDTDGTRIINLLISGAREFALDGIVIGGTPCTDFTFKRIIKDHKETPEEAEEEARSKAGTFAAQTAKLNSGTSERKYSSGLPPRRALSARERESVELSSKGEDHRDREGSKEERY